MTTGVERDARGANLDVYRQPGAVLGYLCDPYHAVRRELAGELLRAALDDPTRPVPHGPILEVGSGTDSMLGDVFPDRSRVSGDIAASALAAVKGDRVCFDAARPLPFADGSLAAIATGELIEHVFDPARMLGEFHRVLKPGGVLIVTTPNMATPQDRLRFLAGRSPRQVDALHPYLHLHIRPFTASSLRRMLAATGFRVAALRSNFVGWEVRGRWHQSRRLARLVPTWGGSLVVAARREEITGVRR